MEIDPDDRINDGINGLTKREYFAIMALQGILSKPDHYVHRESQDWYVIESVRFADGLITELNKGEKDEI